MSHDMYSDYSITFENIIACIIKEFDVGINYNKECTSIIILKRHSDVDKG